MRIKETTERDCCCPTKDLKVYAGIGKATLFCIHCGQLWKYVRVTDAAGDKDWELVKCIPNDDETNQEAAE